MTPAERLRDRIERREAVVCVVGLGYVGLPLAVTFAEAGFRVVGVDTDAARVAAVNAGRSHVPDVASEAVARLALGEGRLSAAVGYDAVGEADAVLICVPTPLGKTRDPDVSYIVAAASEVAPRLREGALVVLESTTYPGTTEELVLPRLVEGRARPLDSRFRGNDGGEGGNDGGEGGSDGRGARGKGCSGEAHPHPNLPPARGKGHLEGASAWEVGRDFFLAFSPERVDPGREDWTIANTPKVIGGVTAACTEAASRLYGAAIERVVAVSSSRAAEMVKLLENTFRAANIALANEMAIMCDHLGLDVWEVIDAGVQQAVRVHAVLPGAGTGRPLHPGGPALPGVEDADAGVHGAVHPARGRDQLGYAAARGAGGDAGAGERVQAAERGAGAGAGAWRTSRTWGTRGSRRRWT